MTQIEDNSHGNYRIFSKLGAGYSSSRSKGEILSNAYACLPIVGSDGKGKSGSGASIDQTNINSNINSNGVEFTIHVRGSIDNDVTLVAVEEQVLEAMVATVNAIVDGTLQ
mgnify:CR=1 FL=1